MRTMNKKLITLMAAALALLSASGQVTFTGIGEHHVIVVTPDKSSTGLDSIFVVFDTEGVGMTYPSTTGERAVWCTFDSNTWSYPDTLKDVRWNGYATTLEKVVPNKGYIIEEDTRRHFYWVVNYADYYLELNDIFFIDDAPCSLLSFRVDGQGKKIPYSTTTGSIRCLDRDIQLSYNTLMREDSTDWEEVPVVESFESLEEVIAVDPPLCNTVFTLSGDRFLKEWDLELVEAAESLEYHTQAVSCGTTAKQEMRDNKNEEGLKTEGLGGSAPVNITFTGYPTDAVAYRVWETATDPEFVNIIKQDNQNVVYYTFEEYGTYYVRYRVANADGTCSYEGETYTVTVTESKLECPNIFSPGSTEGVNDVWRVSYKSLSDFHCWIFNRWGTLVCEFTDPGDGWDGTYKGRLVDTGVYYYVITATGSDGVNYKRRGDITIMRYKKGANGTSTDGAGG